MSSERASLGLDEKIDIEELIVKDQKPHKLTPEQQKNMEKEGENLVLLVVNLKKRRRVSPYTAQFGGKCREGMKDLFQDIGEHLGCYDTETLEKAILALIQKEGLEDLEKRFQVIIK